MTKLRARRVLSIALFAAIACAGVEPPTRAEPRGPADGLCGPYLNARLELAPVIQTEFAGSANDPAFGCLAWQSLIYLNWPARGPGEPDPNVRFGGQGPAVWETYKRIEEIFRPHAEAPSPWEGHDLQRGAARALHTIHQTGGGILVDRAGRPVYYEMLINRDEFNYIVAHRLYDAEAQLAFAETSGIVLPAGPTREYGPVGTIEIKAAWKVLTAAELAQSPRRFYSAEAALEDGTRATVGLVGFHLNQRIVGFTQGVWASFVQIDSATLAESEGEAHSYSFFDPACTRCEVNVRTEPPKSTQVQQVFPVAPSVREINAYAHDLVRAADPASPWQFYDLLGVQWPQFALGLPAPVPDPRRHLARGVPLSVGTPSTLTLMNPVLETFQQSPNVSCLGCHANGGTALPAASGPLAADYSFLFAHAQPGTAGRR
jgi:hypothetical protein